jgi:hypothetical protein
MDPNAPARTSEGKQTATPDRIYPVLRLIVGERLPQVLVRKRLIPWSRNCYG